MRLVHEVHDESMTGLDEENMFLSIIERNRDIIMQQPFISVISSFDSHIDHLHASSGVRFIILVWLVWHLLRE